MRTTLIMALMAGASVAAAAVCYPWPETIELAEQVGQQLFSDLDSDLIRKVEIVKFDADEKRADSIRLRKDSKGWYIPSASNFPLGNTQRISAVLDALGESKILEVKSDDQETHQLYGVLDPTKANINSQTGVGSKLTVSDNNDRAMASLVIGSQVGDQETQRFVRIEGQPNVYVMEFNPQILSTDVSDWVDHNLFDLATETNKQGPQPVSLTIENYVIDAKSVEASKYEKKYNYRAILKPSGQSWQLSAASKANSDGNLEEVKRTSNKLNQNQFAAIVENLAQVPFSEVKKKPKSAIKVLESSKPMSTKDLVEISKQGFRIAQENLDESLFDSSNGQISVSLNNKIRKTINFGKLAGVDQNNAAKITYFAMLSATVDIDAFPEVEKPADSADEDTQKSYDRAVKRRDDLIATTQKLADGYNKRMADWYFILSEDVMATLRPDYDSLITK